MTPAHRRSLETRWGFFAGRGVAAVTPSSFRSFVIRIIALAPVTHSRPTGAKVGSCDACARRETDERSPVDGFVNAEALRRRTRRRPNRFPREPQALSSFTASAHRGWRRTNRRSQSKARDSEASRVRHNFPTGCGQSSSSHPHPDVLVPPPIPPSSLTRVQTRRFWEPRRPGPRCRAPNRPDTRSPRMQPHA